MVENCVNFDNSFVDANQYKTSISAIISSLEQPFDKDGVAQKTFNKHYENPDSIYYHKSVGEIKEMWENKAAVSRDYGKKLDDYIGARLEGNEDDMLLYKLDYDVADDERLQGLCKSFDDFLEYFTTNYNVTFIAREQPMYLKVGDSYVSMRLDALFYNNDTKKYIVIDWKSNNDGIVTKPTIWTENLLGAANSFKNINHNTYTFQVYGYKMALLHHYLPEGTDASDIETYIVNLPGHDIDNGKFFKVHSAAFNYDEELLNGIYTFGIKKNQLLEKMKRI